MAANTLGLDTQHAPIQGVLSLLFRVRMRPVGKITLRGPYGPNQLSKVLEIVNSHPFNTEIMCCLPFLQENRNSAKQLEEVKRLEYSTAYELIS